MQSSWCVISPVKVLRNSEEHFFLYVMIKKLYFFLFLTQNPLETYQGLKGAKKQTVAIKLSSSRKHSEVPIYISTKFTSFYQNQRRLNRTKNGKTQGKNLTHHSRTTIKKIKGINTPPSKLLNKI